MTKIKINGISVEQKEYSNILDAILAQTLDDKSLIDYQCRDGYCGSCRCILISGKVGYIKPTLAFLAKNEILPCCAVALTELELKTKI